MHSDLQKQVPITYFGGLVSGSDSGSELGLLLHGSHPSIILNNFHSGTGEAELFCFDVFSFGWKLTTSPRHLSPLE